MTCLNSGAVNDTAGRVRIAAIEGPGACGIDYPLRVSALGESGPLSYDDEPVPPGSIPNSSMPRTAMPQNWPGASPADSVESVAAGASRRAAILSAAAKLSGDASLPAAAILSGAAAGRADRRPAVARAAGNARRRRRWHSGRPAASLLRRAQRAEYSRLRIRSVRCRHRRSSHRRRHRSRRSAPPRRRPPSPACRCKCSRRRRSPAR